MSATPAAWELSCADSAFRKLTHETALAVIRDLGIPRVDVGVFAGYEHTTPDMVVEDAKTTARSVQRRLERAGLGVGDVFGILSSPLDALAVNHPDPAARREARRYFEALVDFAKALGASGLTVLPGATFPGVASEESLELAAAELREWLEVAGDAELELSVEPHVGSVVPTPAETLQLLEETPGLTITLDCSHFVYQSIPQDDVEALLPRTRHVHLRQAAPGAIQACAHEGTIDIGQLVRSLAASSYSGLFGLEYQWEEVMDFNRCDCISETAALRDVFLRAVAGAGG